MAYEVNISSQEYADYIHSIDATRDIINPIVVAFHSAGFIGSILTLATVFKNKAFTEPCFICYQAIAVSELIYTFARAVGYMFSLYPVRLSKYLFTSWIRYVACVYALDAFAYYNIILSTFLSLQRAFACFLPTKFHYVNRRWLCVAVCVVPFIVMFAFLSPPIFLTRVYWNEEENRYDYTDPPSTSNSYKTYMTVLLYIHFGFIACVAISSALAIAGMLKAAAHR